MLAWFPARRPLHNARIVHDKERATRLGCWQLLQGVIRLCISDTQVWPSARHNTQAGVCR